MSVAQFINIIMAAGKKGCPRPGRSPWRRKKSCLIMGFACIVLYGFIQMTQFNEGYTALRPLSDAQSEAKRLLKFITHYNYQCNSTVQVGNRSHWPICVEKDVGIDLDSKEVKLMYTVGSNIDLMVERYLTHNHTFQVFVITQIDPPYWARHLNNTYFIKAGLVPNDPADFTRNSYGQKTLNTVFNELHHDSIEILRLINVERGTNMWEIIHFMNYDNLLLKVQQFHLAMYIEKLDDDYLYNWYRALYELFYKQGFRLYHTSSHDSLCLQVTMMESCMYYLSFIKNPGPHVFVLHPPADYGTSEMEEERLLHYLSTPQVECKQEILGSPNDQTLSYASHDHFQWQVCANGLYELFRKPCSVFRFRSSNDHVLEEKFIHEGCSVYTFEPIRKHTGIHKSFKMHSHQPLGLHQPSIMSQEKSSDEILQLLHEQKDISLIEIDLPGYEWEILTQLLDSGILENTTQIIAHIQLPDSSLGNHPTILRSHYSELRRLEVQGFNIFHTQPLQYQPLRGPKAMTHQSNAHCCFRVGFLKKENFYR